LCTSSDDARAYSASGRTNTFTFMARLPEG
jgi:hypothetical protein